MSKARQAGKDVYMSLLDHRDTPQSAIGLSPATVLLGHATHTAMLPMPHAPPTATEATASASKVRHQQKVKDVYDKHARGLPHSRQETGCGSHTFRATGKDGLVVHHSCAQVGQVIRGASSCWRCLQEEPSVHQAR